MHRSWDLLCTQDLNGWIFDNDDFEFAEGFDGHRQSRQEANSERTQSANIELCVTKLRLSGLGVGFFDLKI